VIDPMAQATARQHSNAYNIFILVLTTLSLVIMVVMFLPLGDAAIGLLQVYDNLIAIIFLVDFFLTLKSAPDKYEYFLKRGGWLDLLGSIPAFGIVLRNPGLLRLARLSRLIRIARKLGKEKDSLIRDVMENRSRYGRIITVLIAISSWRPPVCWCWSLKASLRRPISATAAIHFSIPWRRSPRGVRHRYPRHLVGESQPCSCSRALDHRRPVLYPACWLEPASRQKNTVLHWRWQNKNWRIPG
jgi:hypothetical protein